MIEYEANLTISVSVVLFPVLFSIN